MSKDTLYMETTEISSVRSISEITGLLVQHGASQINTQYADGKPTGLQWTINLKGRVHAFSLPVKVEPVYHFLKKKQSAHSKKTDGAIRDQAERVAWRQLFRWTQVQMALLDLGMVDYQEVFFAYHWDGTKTLYEGFMADPSRMLPAPEVP